MASTDPQPEPLDFRRAIICALHREFDAVEALLMNFMMPPRESSMETPISTARMGKGSAASAASTLRISFPNIDFALVVGICGGVPFPTEKTELILGDVIISHQLVKVDFGRQYPDRFEQKGSVFETLDRSHREIRCLLSGLQTRREQERFQDLHFEYVRNLEEKNPIWRYPGVDRDELFPSSSQHVNDGDTSLVSDCRNVGCQGDLVQRLRLNTQDTPRPRVLFGPMASGDTVMKSAEHRDRLVRKFGVFGFEMEGGGVCDTLSCLIVKGACDYADSHKNNIWQNYAAASAAACAKALLEYMLKPKAEYGAYKYSQCLQTHTGVMSASLTSQSPTDTVDPDEHIKSIRQALNRLGDKIPSTMMRRALLPAATDMIQYNESRVRSLQETERFQSEPRETMFGTIRFQTQTIKHHRIFDNEQETQTETQTSFIFHPAAWLMRLGLRYGLRAMATYHHRTWRYNIQPVHAIPDDSLIFTFFRRGNVDAVRELFKRGDASVFDVGTKGWTPLHTAVYWGHFELAKLLILEGANRRAYTYDLRTPTSWLRCRENTTKPLDMILLFQDCIEFYDAHSDGWDLLSSYDDVDSRPDPQATYECLSFLVQSSRAAGPYDDEIDNQYAWEALARAYRRRDDRSIRMILEVDPSSKFYFDADTAPDAAMNARMFYCRDNPLIQQYFLDQELDFFTEIGGETPASRAIRFASVFFSWRFYMMDIKEGTDFDCLVRQEISDKNPLSLQGWDSFTLRDMFDLAASTQLVNKYSEDDEFGLISCAKEDCPVFEPAFLLYDNRVIVEPWWEELKQRIKTEKCICTMHEFVFDPREPEIFIHTPGCIDPEPSAGCSATRRDSNDSSGNTSSEVAHFGPLAEVTSWFNYCYSNYSGLRCTYKPQEYYCFDCLARREGWESESAAMHEYRSRIGDCITSGDNDPETGDNDSEMRKESDFADSEASEEEKVTSAREGKRKREGIVDEGIDESRPKRIQGQSVGGATIMDEASRRRT
ncbi:hypothetical protein FE257_007936 [Aspergillus nanangensis]|uniref:Nucleoside phosphorylase domain-containing protein n=1 Tax=Aspergillus nanangensis TaxID=2582783 RepID=A0AAD4H081_ASPNN|nr:hypothetical protein FE257_007936 [Aspergillus nanangensis]